MALDRLFNSVRNIEVVTTKTTKKKKKRKKTEVIETSRVARVAGNTYKPTQEEWEEMYEKYPDLRVDPNGVICKKSCIKGIECRQVRLISDEYCLKHTKKNLKDYDIPFLCNILKKKDVASRRGRRCTNIRLNGDEMCWVHRVRKDRRENDSSRYEVARQAKIQKDSLHRQALMSKDPEMKRHLKNWSYRHPRDVVKAAEEIYNRYRCGAIDEKESRMLIYILSKFMDFTMGHQELPVNEIFNNTNAGCYNTNGMKEAKGKVIDLKQAILKMSGKEDKQKVKEGNCEIN